MTGPDLIGVLDGKRVDSKVTQDKLEDSITVIHHSLDFLGPCSEAASGDFTGKEA